MQLCSPHLQKLSFPFPIFLPSPTSPSQSPVPLHPSLFHRYPQPTAAQRAGISTQGSGDNSESEARALLGRQGSTCREWLYSAGAVYSGPWRYPFHKRSPAAEPYSVSQCGVIKRDSVQTVQWEQPNAGMWTVPPPQHSLVLNRNYNQIQKKGFYTDVYITAQFLSTYTLIISSEKLQVKLQKMKGDPTYTCTACLDFGIVTFCGRFSFVWEQAFVLVCCLVWFYPFKQQWATSLSSMENKPTTFFLIREKSCYWWHGQKPFGKHLIWWTRHTCSWYRQRTLTPYGSAVRGASRVQFRVVSHWAEDFPNLSSPTTPQCSCQPLWHPISKAFRKYDKEKKNTLFSTQQFCKTSSLSGVSALNIFRIQTL